MSFISVNIPEAEYRETLTWLAAKPAQVERAERRAVNKTLKWAGGFVARTLSHINRIPLKTLTRGGGTSQGVRVRFNLAKGFENSGSAWIGSNPVKASYVGKLRQLKKGARAGRHFFERAFVASMSTGHVGIFKRRGQSRLGIVEQVVPITAAEQATAAAQRFIPGRLTRILSQEINFEVNVRGR